ncbi:MAG: RagB/SusD family nutrient uptake outer membrane protein [Bacteroidia bacterium]
MKKYKTTKIFTGIIFLTMMGLSSCEINPIEDPNNPSEAVISANATLSEIQNVVDGSESALREQLNQYYDGVSVIGREWYRFSGSDPRFTSDLLGKGAAVLDANTFYTTQPFAARYRAVKNLNILIDALTNSTAVTDADKRRAGIAYAKTLQAYQLLMVLNEQYGNGVRVDVKNPDALGLFLDKNASLDAIANMLNEAHNDLKNNTAAFPFNEYVYGTTPSQFDKFNRAIAARVNVYRADWNNALSALNESFYNISSPLTEGAYHQYSITGGDLLNPVYFPPNSTGETRVAQPSFITDAESGDTRLNKVSLRTTAASLDGLTSDYDVAVYKTDVDPVPIIRNEELILIYAECNAQNGTTTEAVNAINTIRTAAGLSNYSGGTSTQELIDEILKQRRYSLYGEGHRWVDMRRYGKLGDLPIDRPGDDVWVEFPRPDTEN